MAKTHIDVEMEMKGWDEKPYHERDDGSKLTDAVIPVVYSGGLEGEGMLQYLLCYRADQTGVFMGYERVTGSIGDRKGSFVWKHDGIFQPSGVRTTLTIVPGSATGDLVGLRGEGSFFAIHGMKQHVTLDYEFVTDPASWIDGELEAAAAKQATK
jgi:hypothetical protein